jgi:hypothetical protein
VVKRFITVSKIRVHRHWDDGASVYPLAAAAAIPTRSAGADMNMRRARCRFQLELKDHPLRIENVRAAGSYAAIVWVGDWHL